MSRLPLLAVAAVLVAGGAGLAPANASTICVDDICVCTHSVRCLDYPAPDPEPVCVKVDLDGNGTYEEICVL